MPRPLPYSETLAEFVKHFDAHVEHSDRKFQRVTNHPVDWFVDQPNDTDFNIISYQARVENVEAVAIHIPIYKLNDLVSVFPGQKYREMEIREAVPAVKKAYEQYQLLLKMCGGDFDARY